MNITRKLAQVRILDFLVVFFLLIIFSFAILRKVGATRNSLNEKIIRIEIVVPNLEAEVSKSINLEDLLIDQNGKPVFKIVEKIEKASEHPVIDQRGNLVIAKHPKLKSLFLTVESLKPILYENGIKYNWQVVKVGGSLVWETKFSRFVGLVRTLAEV